MSEAEQEIEDFFNEEILGKRSEEEPEPIFPQAPESKPLDEVVIEPEPDEGQEPPPVEQEDVQEQGPDVHPPEEAQEEAPQEEGDPEHVAWAKKKYGDDYDPDVIVKTAYEQERMIGKQAEETRRMKEEQERAEIQSRIDALNTPGMLTAQEDNWVNEAVMSDDPTQWAKVALEGNRPDIYASIMGRWGALGEQEAQQMRSFDSFVKYTVSQPPPDEGVSLALALGQTFISLGLDIDQHGPLVMQKLQELPRGHPAISAIQNTDDPQQRALAVQAVWDLISAGKAVVSKARTDDVVEARVQEEQLRRNAAGVTEGGPRKEPPKRNPFWDSFNEEVEERGWDGNRPHYGLE